MRLILLLLIIVFALYKAYTFNPMLVIHGLKILGVLLVVLSYVVLGGPLYNPAKTKMQFELVENPFQNGENFYIVKKYKSTSLKHFFDTSWRDKYHLGIADGNKKIIIPTADRYRLYFFAYEGLTEAGSQDTLNTIEDDEGRLYSDKGKLFKSKVSGLFVGNYINITTEKEDKSFAKGIAENVPGFPIIEKIKGLNGELYEAYFGRAKLVINKKTYEEVVVALKVLPDEFPTFNGSSYVGQNLDRFTDSLYKFIFSNIKVDVFPEKFEIRIDLRVRKDGSIVILNMEGPDNSSESVFKQALKQVPKVKNPAIKRGEPVDYDLTIYLSRCKEKFFKGQLLEAYCM